MPTGLGPPKSGLSLSRGSGVTLHQHLALERCRPSRCSCRCRTDRRRRRGSDRPGTDITPLPLPVRPSSRVTWIEYSPFFMMSQVPAAARGKTPVSSVMPKRGPGSVNASGCPERASWPRHEHSEIRPLHATPMPSAAGRIELARDMHSSELGTSRRVLEQEKQVTNWINSGGHAPRRYMPRIADPVKLRAVIASGRWKMPLAIGGGAAGAGVAGFRPRCRPAILDGRYANSPLKQWFDSLASGKGPCCSDADGSAVSDVDWESKGGRITAFALKASGTRFQRMPSSPSRTGSGRTMVWPIKWLSGIEHPLFHAR